MMLVKKRKLYLTPTIKKYCFCKRVIAAQMQASEQQRDELTRQLAEASTSAMVTEQEETAHREAELAAATKQVHTSANGKP